MRLAAGASPALWAGGVLDAGRSGVGEGSLRDGGRKRKEPEITESREGPEREGVGHEDTMHEDAMPAATEGRPYGFLTWV